MIGGLCAREDRYQAVTAAKSMQTIALVLGTGMAAVATFVHTPLPGRLGHIDHTLPKYVKMMHLGNATARVSSEINSFGSLGGMVIPPDQGSSSSHRRKLLSKADAIKRLHHLGSTTGAASLTEAASVGRASKSKSSSRGSKKGQHTEAGTGHGEGKAGPEDPDQTVSRDLGSASKDLGKASRAVTKTLGSAGRDVTKDLSTFKKYFSSRFQFNTKTLKPTDKSNFRSCSFGRSQSSSTDF